MVYERGMADFDNSIPYSPFQAMRLMSWSRPLTVMDMNMQGQQNGYSSLKLKTNELVQYMIVKFVYVYKIHSCLA